MIVDEDEETSPLLKDIASDQCLGDLSSVAALLKGEIHVSLINVH